LIGQVARDFDLTETAVREWVRQAERDADDVPSARQRAAQELTEHIRQAHQASKGRYGAPRIHAELRRRGHRHARKRVARLMRAAGLRGRRPRRWKQTTIPDPAAAARADLVRRDFTVDAAAVNTRWCGDITYIATWEGWPYLATVIDIAPRRVVGFALAEHLRTELVADALTNAVAARDPAPGVVVRCATCDQVLLRLVRGPGRAWLDLRGLTYLQLPMTEAT
jgi:transposase InsO family protein